MTSDLLEKEAKEYRESQKHKSFRADVGTIQINYESYLNNLQSAFQKGAEFGYNKANEWHYLKDGDLPPLNINVLVIHKWSRTPEVGKRITVFTNSSEWVWAMCCDRYRYTSDDKNVIAWKEIVLPELKESE